MFRQSVAHLIFLPRASVSSEETANRNFGSSAQFFSTTIPMSKPGVCVCVCVCVCVREREREGERPRGGGWVSDELARGEVWEQAKRPIVISCSGPSTRIGIAPTCAVYVCVSVGFRVWGEG
jgi:hypothetical protein